MASVVLWTLLLATVLGSATAFQSFSCNEKPLQRFDLKALLNCGYNGASWSVWNVPGKDPYCSLDTVDMTRDGRYLCYDNGNMTCRRVPYIYDCPHANSPNFLERALGNGAKSKSVILDTDNCNFLVQIECFDDGSVQSYVTYKSTWPYEERQEYLAKASWEHQLYFLKGYSLDCEHGRP